MEEQSEDSIQIRRKELIHKSINLQVLKELLQKNEMTIEEKRSSIARQTIELDKLHQEVWNLQSKMCDEVWDFSARHNFLGIFINYPNIDFSLNCDCEGEENNKENVEAQQLRMEIQEIQAVLSNGSHDLLKEDLSRAEKELCYCKQENTEVQRFRQKISEAKGRISNLKAKLIESNAIQDNTHDSLDVEYVIAEFEDFSPDSSAPAYCPQSRNLNQPHSSQSLFPKNNNYYNRFAKHNNNNNSNYDSGFVKASTLTRNEEIQSQFNNNPQCEKIVAEAVSNNDKLSAVNQPKKKFIPKTKSHITQGKKR